MTHRLGLGLACWLLALPAFAGLLVTDVIGKAEVEGRGPAKILTALAEGAHLSLAEGTTMVLVDLKSGREFALTGKASYVVAANGITTADRGMITATALPTASLPDVRIATLKLARPKMVMRGDFGFAPSTLISPVMTAVLSEQVYLQWREVESAVQYRVTVQRADDAVILDQVTRQLRIAVPPSAGLVAGETYSWRVEALGEGSKLSSASAMFSMATAEDVLRLAQLKPVPSAPFGRRVLYLAQLLEVGAFEEASAVGTLLIKERPNDPVIQALAR